MFSSLPSCCREGLIITMTRHYTAETLQKIDIAKRMWKKRNFAGGREQSPSKDLFHFLTQAQLHSAQIHLSLFHILFLHPFNIDTDHIYVGSGSTSFSSTSSFSSITSISHGGKPGSLEREMCASYQQPLKLAPTQLVTLIIFSPTNHALL